MRGFFELFRQEPDYLRLTMGGLVSGVGDWFNSVAVMSLLLLFTHSGLSIAILLSLRTIPSLFIGPIAGVLADKVNRKAILVVTDIARAIVALSFLFVHSEHQIWIAYTATFALVVFTSLFNPARFAIVPQVVRASNLSLANAPQKSTFGAVLAVGSLAGGAITAIWGVNVAFIINSLSFLCSAALCLSIHPKSMGESVRERTHERAGTSQKLMGLLISSRTVRAIFLMQVIWPVGGGIINVLLSVYAFQVFHAENQGVGLLYGSLGVGFIVGGMLTQKFTKFGGPTILVGLLMEGSCHFALSQSPNIWIGAVFLFIATLGAGISNAMITTILMQTVNKRVQGRIFALFGTTSDFILGISMLLAGLALTHVHPRTLGAVGGLVMVCSALCSGWMLVRAGTFSSFRVDSSKTG
ncbi:MFS transporter [Alicyclobacillus dauci]|uniref:MFS transporter n=1 Tax=Alicyclobacillus dauci TaxID=1475485 RepID=A0ABY6YXN0_9BACL|nr:MFS transporter [Alicyclobacillus dauci]WAH35297.1 MFS transporter [Alicyclobacillus dauci]